MIGIDTNVLLRAVLNDAPEQSERAKQFIAGLTQERPGYVSVAVLLEFQWTLRRHTDADRSEIADIVMSLLLSNSIRFEQESLCLRCITQYRDSGIDFADGLIAGIATEAGCTMVHTFDEDAAKRIDAMELVP